MVEEEGLNREIEELDKDIIAPIMSLEPSDDVGRLSDVTRAATANSSSVAASPMAT